MPMSHYRQKHEHLILPCIRGFEQINRFWDNNAEKVVAKILPGEFYVTRRDEIIATTLGSCVSACIWDSKAGVGGMNHFMLPLTQKDASMINWGTTASATRYGNYAMEHMINEILKQGGNRINLKAKVFGGGNVINNMSDVGKNNALFVMDYLTTENIQIVSSDLGDVYPRKVKFEPFSGRAMVKKLLNMHNDTIETREINYKQQLESDSVGGDVELF